MMQQAGGGQASEVRHPSSPRGAPATGNSGNIPNFSLLGQQLYGVNPMMAPGQNFNQSHQFMNQQMMQVPNSGGVAQASQGVQSGLGMQPSQAGLSAESIMNALASIQQVVLQLQAMVPYWAQQNQQFPNVAFQQQAAAAISQIAQVAANMAQQQPQSQQQQQQPQSQQQQNMSQQQQQNMSQQQQQQNMSQQQQQQNMSQQQQQQNMSQQQQHNMACVPQTPISDSQQQQQQQQLSQLFGASVTPAFNFFQQNGSAPGNNNTGGNVGLASNFPALQGGSTGVSVEMGTTATSLANQMAAIDGGVSGNSTSGAGQGLGVPPKSTVPNGGQTFVGGQVGANHGPSVANNISSVIRSKNGSPRINNQIGSAMNRGGTVPGMARDMSHMNNNRSVNSGGMTASPVDDHDVGGARDDDDDGDAENLVPGSYDLVEMEAIEILAEHTHFCEICAKGFKRDANLRMHMRGHGDEYKTPAALARPDKASNEMTVVRQKRFSCPYVGCKRNKKHRKFQPLKTMLCVKNHYRRSHCPKILTCQKCKTKKFSVVADLKTHEKHCGCDKWQCSCGTTFSRKDKLFGHIGLFAGHTPAMNFNDVDGSGALDVSDVNGGPGNPSSMSSPGNDAAGFGLSGGGNLNSGNASSMSLGGGSGMGLGGNGLQGMTSRGGNPGGGSLNMSKDGNAMAPENSSSSDSFPSTGLIPGPAMLQMFTNKFYQTTSGGNSSSDGLH